MHSNWLKQPCLPQLVLPAGVSHTVYTCDWAACRLEGCKLEPANGIEAAHQQGVR